MLAVHAATGADKVEELAHIVAAELGQIADRGPSVAELQRSGAQLKAGLLMALESSSVRAEQMARHLLTHNALIPTQALIASVDEVTPKRIRDFAAKLAAAKPTVTIVGSGKKSRAQAEHTAKIFTRTPQRAAVAGA